MEERLFHDVKKLRRHLDRMGEVEIVLANGCFDILHVGHVRYLEEASTLGDRLVVAINDDRSTRALKGPGRPVTPELERAEILLSLRTVDFVLIFSESTVDNIIRVLRPDVHAKGTDYTEDNVPERESAKAAGCRTVITGDPKDHSSGAIIRRLREEE